MVGFIQKKSAGQYFEESESRVWSAMGAKLSSEFNCKKEMKRNEKSKEDL